MRNIIAVTMLMLNNSTSLNLIEFIFIYKWVISNLISLFELNWKPFMVFLCQEVGFKRPKCSSVCKIVETTTLHDNYWLLRVRERCRNLCITMLKNPWSVVKIKLYLATFNTIDNQ